MNFLFGALLIFIILLPGYAFRKSFLEVPDGDSKINVRVSFTDELLYSLFFSFLLVIPSYLIVNRFVDVNEGVLYLLFINNEKVISRGIEAFEVALFFLYIIVISGLGVFLGRIAQYCVIRYGLDRRFSILKIYSDWYYLFNGKRADINGNANSELNIVWVDILVNTNDGANIYSGYFDYVILNEKEDIERIYLRSVIRRKMASDLGLDDGDVDSYYYMPGNSFIIKGSEILNMNVSYFSEDEGESDEEMGAA